MLFTTTLLSSFIFSVIYPLCFWISFRDPLKNNFHRFHLALPCIVGGIITIFIAKMEISGCLKRDVILWMTLLGACSFISWNKPYPKATLLTIPALYGLYIFAQLQNYFLRPDYALFFINVLSGIIFCSSLFAMNLGHWYLNVHGLPINHLMRSICVFWFFLFVRAVWDIFCIFSQKILYDGSMIPIPQFIMTIDGFLLLIALFFGTIFPVFSVYFAYQTLKLKNTQSTTGILYVILCSVLIGDIAYKYYAIKFGIIL